LKKGILLNWPDLVPVLKKYFFGLSGSRLYSGQLVAILISFLIIGTKYKLDTIDSIKYKCI